MRCAAITLEFGAFVLCAPRLVESGLGDRLTRNRMRFRIIGGRLKAFLLHVVFEASRCGGTCDWATAGSASGSNSRSGLAEVISSTNSCSSTSSAEPLSISGANELEDCFLRGGSFRLTIPMPRERFTGKQAAAVPHDRRFNQRGRLVGRRRSNHRRCLGCRLLSRLGRCTAVLSKRFARQNKRLWSAFSPFRPWSPRRRGRSLDLTGVSASGSAASFT